jgi:hypothetical protein
MTTPTTWIPITTRRPTEEDLPVWLHDDRPSKLPPIWLHPKTNNPFLHISVGDATHWQPAQLPPPPPKERTQREEDEEALFKWHGYMAQFRGVHLDTWRAALAYRDAQNRKDMLLIGCGEWEEPTRKAFWALRKRCGLT